MKSTQKSKRIGLILASLHQGSSLKLWSQLALDAASGTDPFFIFPGGRLGKQTEADNLRNAIFNLVNTDNLDGLISWSSTIGSGGSFDELKQFHSSLEPLPFVTIGQKITTASGTEHPCADCGGWYGSKVWNSTDRYRKIIYRCNNKYNGKKCKTPHVTEEEVKAAFVSAYNKLVTEKTKIVNNLKTVLRTVCQTDELQKDKNRLEQELSVLVEIMNNSVKENARIAQDQDAYRERYNELAGKYDALKEEYDKVVVAITAKEVQGVRLENFIKELKAQDGVIREFDERLWGGLVAFVTVGKGKEITVTFKDGTEIQA